jgi:cell division protein FtsL
MSGLQLPQNGELKRMLMGVYRAVMTAGIVSIGAWIWNTHGDLRALSVKLEWIGQEIAGLKSNVNELNKRQNRIEWRSSPGATGR